MQRRLVKSKGLVWMSHPSVPPRVPQRKAAEQFNPWRRASGFYPPDIIARQRDLGDGPKRLYDRLVRWAGQQGTCWYGFDKMATELGKCVRQVKSDLAALERYRLIEHRRCGKKLANRYVFLWHPLFDGGEVQSTALPEQIPQESGEVQPDARHEGGEEVQLPASDVQPAAPGDGQPTAHELCNRNSGHRIASSSAESQTGEAVAPEPTDDDPVSKKTPEPPIREYLMEFVRATGIEVPTGRMPVNEIADELARIRATMTDFVDFLKDYAGRWIGAPATWTHVLVSFRRWAADPKTHGAIRTRVAWEEAEKRQRQVDSARQRAIDAPVSCRDTPALLGEPQREEHPFAKPPVAVPPPWPKRPPSPRTAVVACDGGSFGPCKHCSGRRYLLIDTGTELVDGEKLKTIAASACGCSKGREIGLGRLAAIERDEAKQRGPGWIAAHRPFDHPAISVAQAPATSSRPWDATTGGALIKAPWTYCPGDNDVHKPEPMRRRPTEMGIFQNASASILRRGFIPRTVCGPCSSFHNHKVLECCWSLRNSSSNPYFGVLEPVLYLSLYIKQHRSAHYSLLDRVRAKGEWETWLDFFLTGVRDTAEQAATAARRILAVFEEHWRKIETFGRPAASVLRVFEHMQRNPIVSIPAAAKSIGISAPTVAKSLEHMRHLGLLREITGRQRHRLFVYDAYLAILSEGTEPIRWIPTARESLERREANQTSCSGTTTPGLQFKTHDPSDGSLHDGRAA
jgi:hypothetical protein